MKRSNRHSDFWDIVKKIDWPSICHHPKAYKSVSRELAKEYYSKMENFRTVAGEYAHHLLDQLERYTDTVYDGSWLQFCTDCGFEYGLSDDSSWYLCTHIVGCGLAAYDKVMLDPMKISEFKNYREGFTYCFQTK